MDSWLRAPALCVANRKRERRRSLHRSARHRFIAAAIGFASLCASGCGRGGADVPTDAVEVRVRAQDTAWSAYYVLRSDAGVREVSTGREVHLPRGAEVDLILESRDYICLFAMPEQHLRDFAAPGVGGKFHFRAEQAGGYEFRGDELCGLPHTEKTRGRFVIEEPARFQDWVHQREKASR